MDTGGVDPQVVRYSERPELWDAITGLSDEVWPEYNRHGATLNRYWGQLYERFPETGDYVFPAGLATVHIDRGNDTGQYWEPNVWIIHHVQSRTPD